MGCRLDKSTDQMSAIRRREAQRMAIKNAVKKTGSAAPAKVPNIRFRVRIVDWSVFDNCDPAYRSWYLETTADANGRNTGPGWQCLAWHEGPLWLADQFAALCEEKGIEVVRQRPGSVAEAEEMVPGAKDQESLQSSIQEP